MSEKDLKEPVSDAFEDADELETPGKKQKKKNGKAAACCKKVIKFSFSHVGLTVLVFSYCIAGAFIFRHLEVPNEKDSCKSSETDYYTAENDTLGLLWDIGSQISNDGSNKDEIVSKFQSKIRDFGLAVISYNHEYTNNCSTLGEGGEDLDWNWPNTFVFAITIVTTIGYGHISPKTMWGQLVCIAYAVLGIPLMLLCLANIGDVMADIFRYVYSKVCCCGCCRKKNKDKVTSIRVSASQAWKTDASGKPIPPGQTILDDDSDVEDEEDDEDEKITVPLTITMIVIAGWIVGGAVLFSVWEDWDFVQASYFCFITLTTIGFGDLVPSVENIDDPMNQLKLVLAGVYLIFGMALVAMCFTLMQDEIVAKFTWIAEKIGLVSDNPDDEGGDETEEDMTQEN